MLAAATNIGRLMFDCKVIATKSTVPVATADKVCEAIAAALRESGVDTDFPGDDQALLLMRALHTPLMRNHDRMQIIDVRSAEFTK